MNNWIGVYDMEITTVAILRLNILGFNWNDQWSLNRAGSEWWSDSVAHVSFQTDAQQEARSYLSEEMLAGEYRLQ